MIQGQPSALPMGHVKHIYGQERSRLDHMQYGDIRLNVENQRYVELQECEQFEEEIGDQDMYWCMWVVRDVLTDEIYYLKPRSIGSIANEMEVLAWCSK